jgi:predicted transposase YbfD/YdcC
MLRNQQLLRSGDVAMFDSFSVTTATVPATGPDTAPAPLPHSLVADPFSPLSLVVSPALPCPPSHATVDTIPLDIAHHFADLPDPRHPAFCDRHALTDILVIALTAVLCGAKSWEAIATFGTAKLAWFRTIGLQLRNGIPAHDTFSRIFAALNPQAFQQAFTGWINSVCNTLGFCHIPIDGKTVRGSRGPDGTALHLVSAWASEHRLSLAQIAVADKSNEITAIPRLLQLLDVHGALVSIDAMGCQKDIARGIRAGEGDYLLALKDNQPTLYADAQLCFANARASGYEGVSHDTFVTEEVNHGRYEKRVYTVIYEPSGLSTQDEWVDLKAVVEVERTVRVGDKESREVSHYINSSNRATARVLAGAIRGHWGIENGQHWVLDVIFGEDGCRTRHGNAAENLAWLRKMVLSLFRQDDTKGSIPTRQFLAAADDAYRLHMLHLLSEKSA